MRITKRTTAFTLIELLVVIAVIGLLVGILMPTLGKARASSKRAVCASNLKQVGVGLQLYLGDHKDRLPYASFLPSMGPFPLMDREKPIYITKVLKRNSDDPTDIYQCPNDEPNEARPEPNTGKSFFESELSSYEYRVAIRGFLFGGKTTKEIANRMSEQWDRPIAENSIWIFRDFDNFHAARGVTSTDVTLPPPKAETGARRYLYIDGHVTDYEN